MKHARKLTAPTGRPVRAILPTGGATVDARQPDPEDLAHDPPPTPTRKSTKGGSRTVNDSTDVIADPGLSPTDLYEQQRQAALREMRR